MSRSREKPYHHGDLKRALVDAARRLLESEGSVAISFRRLAEMVGVSHAAPLSHFPDRRCLDASVASHGFRELQDRLQAAVAQEYSAPRGPVAAPPPLHEEDRRKPQPAAPEWRLASTVREAFYQPAREAPASHLPTPFRPSREAGRFAEQLSAAFLAYLRFALEHPGLFRAMYAPGLTEGASSAGPEDPAGAYLRELQRDKERAAGLFVELIEQGQRQGEFRRTVSAPQVGRMFTALAEGLARQYLEAGPAALTSLKEAEQLVELMLGALAP